MATVTVSPAAEQFLIQTNEHGRILAQELTEQVSIADSIDVDYELLFLGGYDVQCLTFMLHKEGYKDLPAIINADSVLSRHPISHEPTWRGTNFILSVLLPLMRSGWGKDIV